MRRWFPVLDVRGGTAMHAQGGERNHYRPLRSVFHPEPDPRAIGRALRESLGPGPLYLADLDAIEGMEPDLGLIRDLTAMGHKVWVDAGIRRAEQVNAIRSAGASVIVAGLETLEGPGVLEKCVTLVGDDHLAFSLDLRNGRPMIETHDLWGSREPVDLAVVAESVGVRRLIVLDLARVGTGLGPGTQGLIRQVRQRCPSLSCIVGGGVSGINDVETLLVSGAQGVLVGSALHSGRMPVG